MIRSRAIGQRDVGFVGRHERGDAGAAGVDVAALCPFGANGKAVKREGRNVPPPHANGRVALPAVGRIREGIEDLKGFDALLAESGAVEGAGGCGEVAVGEEGLNNSLLLFGEPVPGFTTFDVSYYVTTYTETPSYNSQT